MAVLFLLAMAMMIKRSSEQYTEWDLNTTTISDYTVRYQIPENLYNYYSNSVYPQEVGGDPKESKIYSFKRFLKREVEKLLSQHE